MGEVVYLKDRRPEAPGQIIANLEKARQDMEDVERQIDEHLEEHYRCSPSINITLRQAVSTIGLMLLIVGFILWRIKYGT